MFSPDRPIESESDDLLGRSTFARKLAEAINAWRERDSLVVALFGPWGTLLARVKESCWGAGSTARNRLQPYTSGAIINPFKEECVMAQDSVVTRREFLKTGAEAGAGLAALSGITFVTQPKRVFRRLRSRALGDLRRARAWLGPCGRVFQSSERGDRGRLRHRSERA